jgi:threonine synthase
VAAPDRFIAWCKQEQASIEQELELLASGKVRTGEDIGAGWIDTTDESIERAKTRLAELNGLLSEAGSATVVKPDDI